MIGKPSKAHYGVQRTPINRAAAIAIGLVEEGGRGASSVVDSGILPEAKSALKLKSVLGISLELASKCLKNQLDKFELGEVRSAIARRIATPISGNGKKTIKYAMLMCPALSTVKVDPKPVRINSLNWKASKICPSCGQKRLCRDFRYCPMCGRRLPQGPNGASAE